MAGVGGAGGPHWSCASVPAREIQHETAPGVAGRASRARAWRGGQGGGGVRRVWQHTLVAASSRTRCSEVGSWQSKRGQGHAFAPRGQQDRGGAAGLGR